MGPKTASASSKSKKGVTFSAALRQTPQADARTVDLAGHQPPIDTLDAALKDLKSLRNLSLSTNTISTIQNIPENVVVLSLGRNAIKRLDGIQAAANSLEQCVLLFIIHAPVSSHCFSLSLLHSFIPRLILIHPPDTQHPTTPNQVMDQLQRH
jgi:Leucine-rich repeat (LRR) protein